MPLVKSSAEEEDIVGGLEFVSPLLGLSAGHPEFAGGAIGGRRSDSVEYIA
jgi:hypothetical protein